MVCFKGCSPFSLPPLCFFSLSSSFWFFMNLKIQMMTSDPCFAFCSLVWIDCGKCKIVVFWSLPLNSASSRTLDRGFTGLCMSVSVCVCVCIRGFKKVNLESSCCQKRAGNSYSHEQREWGLGFVVLACHPWLMSHPLLLLLPFLASLGHRRWGKGGEREEGRLEGFSPEITMSKVG